MHFLKIKPLIFMAILSGAGCATRYQPSVFSKFDELEISRSFSSESVGSRRFALHFAAVDPALGLPLEAAEDLFVQGFAGARVDLRTLRTAPSKKLRAILKGFQGVQEFPAEGYALLSQSEDQQSWFVIADIENTFTKQDVNEEELKSGEGKTIGRKYSFISERSVRVRYFIYDPIAKALVLSGLVSTSTQAQNDRVTTDDHASDFWNAVTGQVSHDDHLYPEYPSFAKTLLQNIEQFSKNLPRARGQK